MTRIHIGTRMLRILIICMTLILYSSGESSTKFKSNKDVEKVITSKLKSVNNLIQESTSSKMEHKLKTADLRNTMNSHIDAQNGALAASKEAAQAAHGGVTTSSSASNGVKKSKMQNTLRVHGVNDELIREINNMASSLIPKESIIKHVQTHFPDKRQHEWNDIVIAAIGVMDSTQPKPESMIKAKRDAALAQARKFDESKKALETKRI